MFHSYKALLCVAFVAALSGATADRQLLQAACGPLVPDSLDPPANAQLYLSVRGPMEITYVCREANKPIVLSESSKSLESDPKVSERWSGSLETTDEGVRVLTVKKTTKPEAENRLTLGDKPVLRPKIGSAPEARWVVVSNEGDPPQSGGIPGQNYVTRVDVVGGGAPRTCKEGETVTVEAEATYNIYTCEPAYIGPSSGPSASGPVARPPATAQPPAASSPSPAALSPPVLSPPTASPPLPSPPVPSPPVPSPPVPSPAAAPTPSPEVPTEAPVASVSPSPEAVVPEAPAPEVSAAAGLVSGFVTMAVLIASALLA